VEITTDLVHELTSFLDQVHGIADIGIRPHKGIAGSDCSTNDQPEDGQDEHQFEQ
jgi:hypothetical protein